MKLHLTPEQAALVYEDANGSPDLWHFKYTLCCGCGVYLTPCSALRPVRDKPNLCETVLRPKEAP